MHYTLESSLLGKEDCPKKGEVGNRSGERPVPPAVEHPKAWPWSSWPNYAKNGERLHEAAAA